MCYVLAILLAKVGRRSGMGRAASRYTMMCIPARILIRTAGHGLLTSVRGAKGCTCTVEQCMQILHLQQDCMLLLQRLIRLVALNYFMLRAEDLEAVKLLTQWWVDAEITETLKDGAIGTGMKFIIGVAENQ